jgi:hypothetical protein
MAVHRRPVAAPAVGGRCSFSSVDANDRPVTEVDEVVDRLGDAGVIGGTDHVDGGRNNSAANYDHRQLPSGAASVPG